MNIVYILGVVAFIVVVFLVVKFAWARRVVYALVLQAELYFFGEGRGKEKKDYVLGQAYSILPKWLQIFLNPKALDWLVEKGVLWLKDYLDNGKLDGFNLSVETEADKLPKPNIVQTENGGYKIELSKTYRF